MGTVNRNPQMDKDKFQIYQVSGWDDEEEQENWADDFVAIFDSGRIRISSVEQPFIIAREKSTEKMVGACVVDIEFDDDGDESVVTFSVAIHPDYRRFGIARDMVAEVIRRFPRCTIKADVVNPNMAKLVESLGLNKDDTDYHVLLRNGRAIPIDSDFINMITDKYVETIRDYFNDPSKYPYGATVLQVNLPTHTGRLLEKKKNLLFRIDFIDGFRNNGIIAGGTAWPNRVVIKIYKDCRKNQVLLDKTFRDYKLLKSVIVHEITHASDMGVNETSRGVKKSKNDEIQGKIGTNENISNEEWRVYYNIPTEVRARIGEWVELWRNDRDNNKFWDFREFDYGNLVDSLYKRWLSRKQVQDNEKSRFDYWMKTVFPCGRYKYNLENAWKYLTDENKKKVYRALYSEFARPQQKETVSAHYFRSCFFLLDEPAEDIPKYRLREILGVSAGKTIAELRKEVNDKYWYYESRKRVKTVKQ